MSLQFEHGQRVMVAFKATVIDPVPDAYQEIRVRADVDGELYDVPLAATSATMEGLS